MKRLLVNDCLTAIPGTRTFWHDLMEWFDMEFVGGSFDTLRRMTDGAGYPNNQVSIIIRNASYFGPLEHPASTISLLQDIFTEGPQRKMQEEVIKSSQAVVFNSNFTSSKYPQFPPDLKELRKYHIIPLPVDFDLFQPGNPMGLQQALSLPDGCVCWVGASQGAAGHVKGYDIFLSIVRQNPDIPFVGIFKDSAPEYGPPNLRMFTRLTHEELVKVIGACRVGLCTSRMESQHLAGIEMGACGLAMVAPPVGVYWNRDKFPITLVPSSEIYNSGIRVALANPGDPQEIRSCWQKEFSKPVIRKAWENLIREIERVGPGANSPTVPDRDSAAGLGGTSGVP
ncbi:MAG: hypothetical protein ACE5I8_08560 [Thermodesulfobacteriota bacterium]